MQAGEDWRLGRREQAQTVEGRKGRVRDEEKGKEEAKLGHPEQAQMERVGREKRKGES